MQEGGVGVKVQVVRANEFGPLVTLEVGAFIVCFSKSIDGKYFGSGICYITLQQLFIGLQEHSSCIISQYSANKCS